MASLAATAGTSSTISLTPNGTTSTTLTVSGTTASANAAVNFNLASGTTNATTSTLGNTVVAWNPTLTAAGIIGGGYTVTDGGGTGYATVSGGEVVRILDTGTPLPTTGGVSTTNYFVNSGYSTSSSTTAGSLVLALTGGVAANTITVDTTGASGANLALGANTLTLTNGGGMLFLGANPYTITGTVGIATSAAGGSTVFNNSTSSTVTIAAPILNNTTSTVTFTGPGTTILTAVNTYAGATTISAGSTLQIGSAGSLASGTYAAAISDNGTLQYSSSAAQTLSGAITGTGALIKDTSASALTLSNTTNTYSGGVTINASSGTLVANTTGGTNATGLGTGAIAIGSGSTLNLLSANTVSTTATINNTITGSGGKVDVYRHDRHQHPSRRATGFTGSIELANTTTSNKDKLDVSGGTYADSLLTIDNASQLLVASGTTTFTNGISITGTGNAENLGAIRLVGTLAGGNIGLAGNTTIGAEAGTITNNISNITGTPGTQTLTNKNGNASDNDTFSGNISNNAGILALSQTASGDHPHPLRNEHLQSAASTISARCMPLAGSASAGAGHRQRNRQRRDALRNGRECRSTAPAKR